MHVEISPTPTEEEAAAIMAAYESLWPKPTADDARGVHTPRWRFSGRWWVEGPTRRSA